MIQYSLAVGFKSGSMRVFDIESTSTITERKVNNSPVASILFVRSAPYPAVRTGAGIDSSTSSASSYAFPSTRALASAIGRTGAGADRGMADMFDMSSPVKVREIEMEKDKSKIIDSSAARLLLFTAGKNDNSTHIKPISLVIFNKFCTLVYVCIHVEV